MNIDRIDAEIGERVHQEMWRKRVSQRELARALGIDPAAASRRLRGQTAWKFTDIVLAARLLGVSAGELCPEETSIREEAGAEFRCALPRSEHTGLRIVHGTHGTGRRSRGAPEPAPHPPVLPLTKISPVCAS